MGGHAQARTETAAAAPVSLPAALVLLGTRPKQMRELFWTSTMASAWSRRARNRSFSRRNRATSRAKAVSVAGFGPRGCPPKPATWPRSRAWRQRLEYEAYIPSRRTKAPISPASSSATKSPISSYPSSVFRSLSAGTDTFLPVLASVSSGWLCMHSNCVSNRDIARFGEVTSGLHSGLKVDRRRLCASAIDITWHPIALVESSQSPGTQSLNCLSGPLCDC
jgi:hypothetical protein